MGRGHTPSLSRECPGQRFRGQPAESGEGTRWEGRHREKLQASGSGAPLRCSLRSEARSRPDPEEVAAARAVLAALAGVRSPLLSLYPLSEVSATPFSETRKRFQSCDIMSESAWPANGRRELLTGTPASASSDNFMPCDHFADEGPSWGASPLREHAVGKVRVGSVALPGSWISRVPGERCLPKNQGPLHRWKLPSSNRETTSFAWQVPGAPRRGGKRQSRWGLHLRGFVGAPHTKGCSHIRPGRRSDDARARLPCRHGEVQHLRQEGPATSQAVAQG